MFDLKKKLIISLLFDNFFTILYIIIKKNRIKIINLYKSIKNVWLILVIIPNYIVFITI